MSNVTRQAWKAIWRKTMLSLAVAILISSDFSSDIEGESAGGRSVSDSDGATGGNNYTFGIFFFSTTRGAVTFLLPGQKSHQKTPRRLHSFYWKLNSKDEFFTRLRNPSSMGPMLDFSWALNSMDWLRIRLCKRHLNVANDLFELTIFSKYISTCSELRDPLGANDNGLP